MITYLSWHSPEEVKYFNSKNRPTSVCPSVVPSNDFAIPLPPSRDLLSEALVDDSK
jgi:hypothetical protein